MKKVAVFILFVGMCFLSVFGAERKIAVSSYPWQKTTVAKMLDDLDSIGVKNIALFGGMTLGAGAMPDSKLGDSMSGEEMAEAKKYLDSRGFKIAAYSHMRAAKEADIDRIFKFAKFFGIESMTIECPPSALPFYDERCGTYGIRAGLYNHAQKTDCPYPTPEKMLSAISGLKNIKTFPDSGHWGRSGFDIVECLGKLKGTVVNVNLQDLRPDDSCEVFGRGRLPLDAFLEELDNQRFDGYCVVMFGVMENPLDAVAPSVKYLRSRPSKIQTGRHIAVEKK